LVFFAVGFWLLASDKTKPLTGCVLLFWCRSGFFGGGFGVDSVRWWWWWRVWHPLRVEVWVLVPILFCDVWVVIVVDGVELA
jgi:hypothetical protein